MKLIVPPRERVIQTSEDDVAAGRYYGIARWFYRKRLQMALDFMGDNRYGKILDVGCGSGIFEPSLSQLGDVTAIDIHGMLNGVRFEFPCACYQKMSLFDAPWGKEFDVIVCMSVLEHMKSEKIEGAVRKLLSMVREGGFVLIGIPEDSGMVELWFRLNNSTAYMHHKSSREDIVAVMQKYGHVQGMKRVPGIYRVYKVG